MEKNLFEMEGVDKKWERLVWNAGINGFTSTVFTLYVSQSQRMGREETMNVKNISFKGF